MHNHIYIPIRILQQIIAIIKHNQSSQKKSNIKKSIISYINIQQQSHELRIYKLLGSLWRPRLTILSLLWGKISFQVPQFHNSRSCLTAPNYNLVMAITFLNLNTAAIQRSQIHPDSNRTKHKQHMHKIHNLECMRG